MKAGHTEPKSYPCWTITQPYWLRLAPPFPEELAQRRPRYGWITVIVTGTLLAVTGLHWLFPWYIAATGGLIVAVALLLVFDKLEELRLRSWMRSWPERYQFVPGSARPTDNWLRGHVIDPPSKEATIVAWQRFLADMRLLPQHYAVVRRMVRKAEAELARRTPLKLASRPVYTPSP